MIHVIKGDLLKSDCTILAHQANCFSTMGAGIAKQIKEKYPEAFLADKQFKLPPRARLGNFSFALSEDKSKMIFNLYGQFRYGKGRVFTQYDKLEEAIDKMLQACQMAEDKGFPIKIGMPLGIGSGLAGGDKNIILEMIEKLSETYNRDIYLYDL